VYRMFYGQMIRAIAVSKRAGSQESVRILLVRLRQELKRATTVVQIEKQRQMLAIPLEDYTKPTDDPDRNYFSQYEFMPESGEIIHRRLSRDRQVVWERTFLGGLSQILKFKVYDTGENERILFQYYRVVIDLEHYEVKMRNSKGPELDENGKRLDAIALTTTIYPRRVNMELRIEVPQEGSTGI